MNMPDQQRKRLLKIGIPIAMLLLLLTFGSALVRLQADAWWYTLDARASVVFYAPLRIRSVLFVIGALVSFLALYASVAKALRANIIIEHAGLIDIMPAIKAIHRGIRKLLVPACMGLGVVFGLSFSSLWEKWLLQANAETFDIRDPIFNLDYSWFVFELPWRQGLFAWLGVLAMTVLLATALVYYIVPLLAQAARMPIHVPKIQNHICVLVSAVFVLVGISIWYSRFDAGSTIGDRFTGAGYAEMQALGAKAVLAVITFLAGVFILVRRRYAAIALGLGTSAAVFFLGVAIWPALVQSYKVAPNELALQAPYIENALDATRYAYSLNGIESVDYDVQLQPTQAALSEASTTLENMRLWDPKILRETIDNLQSLRNYFGFQDIDVDRYTIDGRQRLIMLGARDLISNRLDASRRNWQNLRLQYTHGNGVVAVPVNRAEASGQPEFLLQDIPPRGVSELQVDQPRIYFSDSQNPAGTAMDRYVFVRSAQPEFDYSAGGEKDYRWEGSGGIPISGGWRRFVYSYYFGDKDLLFTDAFTAETRLLYRRNIRDRAAHILPFLKWDNDPYITIVDGRLVWILDGYTITNAIPYSAMSQVGSTRLNYIRNSVKMTIDAYSGEWAAYVMDAKDPILRAYSKIYPGLLSSPAEAPEQVRKHFRYPEDLFLLQAFHLALYHALDTDPAAEPAKFFRYEDAWQVPDQAHSTGETGPMSPYFVQMRLPNEKKDGFLLILPFNPKGRPNMIGWLAAHCDPDEYGKLQLFRFPRDKNINGPAQQEASFQTDLELSKQITLIGQVGSEVLHGNLLVVPVGQSVMYVKTLFLVSRQSGIKALPELKLVVLAYSNKIVFAENYPRALQLLTSRSVAGPIPEATEGTLDATRAQQAIKLLERGQDALGKGDWSGYGRAQAELESLLREAAKAPASGSER
jgi:uncharacterized membrane protein (UPF0182 family)